ncbi:hypothetical protein P9112_003567 [Eukaryota sp. TZLM1-RC]
MSDRGRGRGRGGDRGRGRGDRGGRGRGGDRGRGGRGRGGGPGQPKDIGADFLRGIANSRSVGQGQLMSNFHRINISSEKTLYVYAPSFPAEVNQDRPRRRLISSMWLKAFGSRDDIPYDDIVFDGNLIYALREIPEFDNMAYDVSYQIQRQEHTWNMDITPIRQVANRDCTSMDNAQELEQLHASLLKFALRNSDLLDFRGNFYDRTPRQHPLSGDFDILPGWIPRILWRECGWVLEVNTHNKCLSKKNMLTEINEFRNQFRGSEEEFKREASDMVATGNFWLSHTRKFVSFDGIDWDMSPRNTFDKNGKPTSFAAYFKEMYKVNLDPNQPMAFISPPGRDTTYFPLELLRKGGNFPAELLEIITQLTQTLPGETVQRVEQFFESMNKKVSRNNQPLLSPNQFLKRWGIEIPTDSKTSMIVLNSMKLQKFNIDIGSEKLTNDPHSFKPPALKNLRIPNPQVPRSWIFVYHDACSRYAENILETIKRQMKTYVGKNVPNPIVLKVPGRSRFEKIIDNALRGKAPPSLIFACAVDQDSGTYDGFKNYCSPRGIVTQYMAASKLQGKPDMVIASNLVFQTQAKLGATLWNVELSPKLFGPNGSFPTLVLGMDVFHQAKKNSCLALVGMFAHQNRLRFFSKTQELEPRQEISDFVAPMVQECLQFFAQNKAPKPQSIIFYRDGVGEHQFDLVRKRELDPVKQVISKNVPNTPLVFCIVQKRINTKFFDPSSRDFNLIPGTVINNTVTRDSKLYPTDFYIQSHETKVGTSTPVHIDILHNGLPPQAQVTPQDICNVTYALSHMYYNQASGIKVPSVCHYAHCLAMFIGEHSLAPANAQRKLMPIPRQLWDKLHFI